MCKSVRITVQAGSRCRKDHTQFEHNKGDSLLFTNKKQCASEHRRITEDAPTEDETETENKPATCVARHRINRCSLMELKTNPSLRDAATLEKTNTVTPRQSVSQDLL